MLLLLGSFWLFSLVLACFFGAYPLPPERIADVLLSPSDSALADPTAWHIVLRLRLCRVLLSALVGGALALAGLLLQAVLRNSLADPFTLGISQGAACGASLLLAANLPFLAYLSHQFSNSTTELVSLAAFCGALAATAATVALARSGKTRLERSQIILAGIAVSTFLGAVVAWVKALNEESLTSIVFWIMGSFQGRDWGSLPTILFSFLPAVLVLLISFRSLDLFFLEDLNASVLGLNVPRLRLMILSSAALLTAGSVAVSGIIGFVGLVVPHILRLLLGPAHGPLLPGSFFGGGILLIWSDVLARSCLPDGQEIPVGVVTALIGGPFFAALIRSRS